MTEPVPQPGTHLQVPREGLSCGTPQISFCVSSPALPGAPSVQVASQQFPPHPGRGSSSQLY